MRKLLIPSLVLATAALALTATATGARTSGAAQEAIPGSRLEVFEGAGHFPHREDPERAAAEIAAFFDRLAG